MAIIVITIILNYHHNHKKFRSFTFIMLMMLRAILSLQCMLIVINFFSTNYAQDHLHYPDAECVDYDDRYNQNHDHLWL